MLYSTAYTFLSHKFLAYRLSKGPARKLSMSRENAIANHTAFWSARISRITFWRANCVSYLRYARKRLMSFWRTSISHIARCELWRANFFFLKLEISLASLGALFWKCGSFSRESSFRFSANETNSCKLIVYTYICVFLIYPTFKGSECNKVIVVIVNEWDSENDSYPYRRAADARAAGKSDVAAPKTHPWSH